MGKITAQMLQDLLEVKHSKDLYISECKDGPTWDTDHLRVDGIAIAKSWAHPCITGYEIKVSRSDFKRDEKWPQYLGLCNEFYFVTPPGLIKLSELPDNVGLIVCSKNAKRLFTKRKAENRDIEFPQSMIQYILNSRVEVVAKSARREWADRHNTAEAWRWWLEENRATKWLGRNASKAIRGVIDKEIDEVRSENAKLKKINAEFDEIRNILEKLGVKTEREWDIRYQGKRAIRDANDVIDAQVRHVHKMLERAHRQIGREIEMVADGIKQLEIQDKESAS